jgi:hypothetical protein
MMSKGCVRSWSWPNVMYCPTICVEELKKKPRETSVRIMGLLTDTRTGYLPNTSQKRYRMNHSVWRAYERTKCVGIL